MVAVESTRKPRYCRHSGDFIFYYYFYQPRRAVKPTLTSGFYGMNANTLSKEKRRCGEDYEKSHASPGKLVVN